MAVFQAFGAGGPVQTLCDALGIVGGTWNQKGDILIGALNKVQRVSDSGGTITDLSGHAAAGRKILSAFLPDGAHYVATRDNLRQEPGVWLDSMEGPEEQRLLPDVSNPQISPIRPCQNLQVSAQQLLRLVCGLS